MKPIDYIGILRPYDRKLSKEESDKLSEIARQCKELVKKHNVQIIIPESHITGEHFL